MLNDHVQVPRLTDAQEDRYSALFKDVDVGRCRVIPEAQGPFAKVNLVSAGMYK